MPSPARDMTTPRPGISAPRRPCQGRWRCGSAPGGSRRLPKSAMAARGSRETCPRDGTGRPRWARSLPGSCDEGHELLGITPELVGANPIGAPSLRTGERAAPPRHGLGLEPARPPRTVARRPCPASKPKRDARTLRSRAALRSDWLDSFGTRSSRSSPRCDRGSPRGLTGPRPFRARAD